MRRSTFLIVLGLLLIVIPIPVLSMVTTFFGALLLLVGLLCRLLSFVYRAVAASST